jgi:hypothetical protein
MSSPASTHHLMRVRIRTNVFRRLQKIAKEERERAKDYTSVSDLVRCALNDYINVYESTSKLFALEAERTDKKAAN